MNLYKYPRTMHLPWSPGKSRDDLILDDTNHFNNKHVTVSIKMDGETTSLYNHVLHARTTEHLSGHPSRDWVKNLWSKIRHQIPPGWRICGENLYAKHSIHYKNLLAYFLIFSIWNEANVCLAWDETVKIINQLGLKPVPIIYSGLYDQQTIQNLHQETYNSDESEGYVVRLTDSFAYENFQMSTAKYVRANHVQTDNHWLHKPITKNLLKG